MAHSQRVAEYVATHAAGYDAKAIPTGVFVDDVYGNAPASGKLFPADVIVAVDGKPTLTETALRKAIRARARRRGRRLQRPPRDAEGAAPRLREDGGRPEPGRRAGGRDRPRGRRAALAPEGAQDRDRRRARSAGPRRGSRSRSQLLQELGKDVDRGYRVAATGTIAFDGTIGAIGGVKQKTLGARKAHADVFLVPVAGGNAAEAKRYAGGMRVIPVETFQQALRALATLPRKD